MSAKMYMHRDLKPDNVVLNFPDKKDLGILN